MVSEQFFFSNRRRDTKSSKGLWAEKFVLEAELRILGNGKKNMVVGTNYNGLGIDTMDDLITACLLYTSDAAEE